MNPSKQQSSDHEVRPKAGKLSKKEKIAYGVGSANDAWGNWFLPAVIWPVFNSYLLMSPTAIGIALMINRLADSVSDPFFGWLSDNTRSKWGRRRPFILIGSILAGIALPLFFYFLGTGWSQKAYFWYFVIGSSIFITIVSCFNMPYQSLGAEMTPDYEERTSVFAFRGGIQKFAEVGNFAAAAFVSLAIFGGDVLAGIRIYSLIIGVLMIVAGATVFFGTKERYYDQLVSKGTNRVKLLETFGQALKCRPFRAQLAMALAYGIGTSMLGGIGYNTTVYYVCRGDFAVGNGWNFWMGISGLCLGFLGLPAFSYLAHRFGKRNAMYINQVFSMIVFGATWFLYTPAVPALQLLAAGLIAFTASGFWMLYGAIGADVVDYDELETGKRREGAFSACGSYLMKIGLALGIGGSGILLDIAGFDAALGGEQTSQALFWMRVFLIGFPLVGLLLAITFLRSFGLTKDRSEAIRDELEARRGTVG